MLRHWVSRPFVCIANFHIGIFKSQVIFFPYDLMLILSSREKQTNFPTGHGEAALTLQRAWNRDPQSLPFAPYIKTHALVSLVQKGLQYHELEHSLDRV